VFDCIKTGFKRDRAMPPIIYGQRFGELMNNRGYREEMVVFTDLIILVVDTMAEANVELFGKVVGITRVVQEMFRKYVGK
jgi:hypothetical protein